MISTNNMLSGSVSAEQASLHQHEQDAEALAMQNLFETAADGLYSTFRNDENQTLSAFMSVTSSISLQ